MRNLNERLKQNHNGSKYIFPHSEYNQEEPKKMLELEITLRGDLDTIISLIPKAVSDFMLRQGKNVKVGDFACSTGNYCWWLTEK